MNINNTFKNIDKQLKNNFIEYINNEFINKIKRIMKKINLNNKNNNYYIKLDLMKKYLISRIDNDYYYKNIKKQLLKFIKKNIKNINDKQINYITNNFLEIYYPYIKEQYINYIYSL